MGDAVKHTPGPWDYFVGNANGRGLIRIEAGNDSPEAGRHIASMPRGAVSEANANLIAAAPELLDFARNVAGLDDGAFTRADLNYFRSLLREYRDEARAAIALAEMAPPCAACLRAQASIIREAGR